MIKCEGPLPKGEDYAEQFAVNIRSAFALIIPNSVDDDDCAKKKNIRCTRQAKKSRCPDSAVGRRCETNRYGRFHFAFLPLRPA